MRKKSEKLEARTGEKEEECRELKRRKKLFKNVLILQIIRHLFLLASYFSYSSHHLPILLTKKGKENVKILSNRHIGDANFKLCWGGGWEGKKKNALL